MDEKEIVLCGASSYEKKFYLNPEFKSLPNSIQEELKIMCVLFTEDVGGILTLIYDIDGSLCFRVAANEDDFLYDEIGSGLKIKELQNEKQDLLEALQMYYRLVFMKGES